MGKVKEENPERGEVGYSELGEEKQGELLAWWKLLRDSQELRGARAQLRRCGSPEEAALHPETYRVQQIVGWARYEAAATIAGILSHIESGENDPAPLGEKLAKPAESGGSSPFSENRFRQLLKSRDLEEFYRNLRRAIQVLRGVVNPVRVADVILAWDRESDSDHRSNPQESLKFRLSRQYYTSAPRPKS